MIIVLSRLERLMLSNQYEILAKLDPVNADSHQRLIEALRDGYELAYQDAFNHVYEEGLNAEECRFVINTLAMYDAVQRSYAALADKQGIDEWRVKFPGFDGNNETSYMSYVRHIVEMEHRFVNVRGDRDLNSHMPMRDEYRRMLQIWERFDKSYEMTKEQLAELLAPPVRRER